MSLHENQGNTSSNIENCSEGPTHASHVSPGIDAQIVSGRKKGKEMFAIIKSGGLQHKVSVGQKLAVNRLAVEDGEQIEINEVLLISDADHAVVGTPFVANAKVLATVEKQTRG